MRRAVMDSAKSHSAMGAIIGTGLSLIGFVLLGITGSPLFILWLAISAVIMMYYLCCLLGHDAKMAPPDTAGDRTTPPSAAS